MSWQRYNNFFIEQIKNPNQFSYFAKMWMDSLIHYVQTEWQASSYWEMIAVVFGMVEVLLAYRNNKWLYAAGLISTSIYVWLYSRPEVGLYAYSLLNIYYVLLSIYGWILWSRPGKAMERSKANLGDWLWTLSIIVAAFFLLYGVLRWATDSATPILDALISSLAWGGVWLLAKHKLENWLVLNLSNLIAIPLLFYKHLPLTGLLTVFLFVVAILGYLKWRREMQVLKDKLKEETI